MRMLIVIEKVVAAIALFIALLIWSTLLLTI
jgi:hypothetical protein